MKIKVSVIEDDPGTLSAVVQLLDGWPALACASRHLNAADALKKIPTVKPDVILADLELPDARGLDCIQTLKLDLPTTPILVFTRHDEADWVFPALQAGASGYLIKDGPPSELLDALIATHRGEAPMSSQIAHKILAYFRGLGQPRAKPSASSPSTSKPRKGRVHSEQLTPEEVTLIELLAEGCTNKQAADRLKVSARTVAYQLELVRQKLHAVSRVNAVAQYFRHKHGEP